MSSLTVILYGLRASLGINAPSRAITTSETGNLDA